MSKWPNEAWAFSQASPNGPGFPAPTAAMPHPPPAAPDVPHIASIHPSEPKNPDKFASAGYPQLENSAVSPTAPAAIVASIDAQNSAESGAPGSHYGPPVPGAGPGPIPAAVAGPGSGQLPGPIMGVPSAGYGVGLAGPGYGATPGTEFNNYNYQIQGDQWSQMNLRPGIASSSDQSEYPKKPSSVSSTESGSSRERESSGSSRKDSASRIAKRSRMGCLTCRQRKKRCCETRPECKECSRLRLKCVWPKPGMEHKNKPKELKLMENTIDHDVYGPIKVLRGIVEYRSDAD